MEQDLKTVETNSDAEVEVLLEKVSQILQVSIQLYDVLNLKLTNWKFSYFANTLPGMLW